ncbi:MAG TPA: efflux RND transporter periplasmic adaptor subunit, partial [Planctomycetota bacterium]|nr:efflux RND transporter periplasmic adaptor subunit [Planctomycetota bacterium]
DDWYNRAMPGPGRRLRRWLIGSAIVAAAAVLGRQTLLAPQPVPVRAAPAERGLVEWTVTNSQAGTVQARRRARLSPGTSGVVTELLVERGARVRRGDVLLRLDAATQSAELALARRAQAVAEANQARACIAAERTRRELERNRTLAAEGLVSVDVLDGLESSWHMAAAECDVAKAEVLRAQAAVDVARAEFDKTALLAPFDAIVAEVPVEVGEWTTPSVPLLAAPDVVEAIDTSSIYVSAPMDEVDTARLRPGLPVRVTVDSRPGETFPGRIVLVAPYVKDLEQQNRTVEIEVELDDAAVASTLLPGTSADVEVVLEVRQDVLRVPAFALQEGGRVLVVEGDRLVERTLVAGRRNWDFVEVESGLEPGELVVTSLDRPEIEAGALVTVQP